MTKYILSLFITLNLFHGIILSQQQYSFQRNYNYILIKFNKNVSASHQDRIIYDAFRNSVKEKNIMRENYSRNDYSINLIVELKENTDISAIEKKLINFKEIEYIGMAFQKNKVLHFTNGEIIVRFKDYINESEINNLNTLYGCNTISKFDLSPIEKNIYLISVNSPEENVFDITKKYSFTPFVEYAQPNFIRTGMLLYANTQDICNTNDSLLQWMWHIRNTGSNIPGYGRFPDPNIHGTPGCDVNVDSAWCISTGNPKILLAIIDTGIDTNHTDLRDNLCDRRLWYDAYDETQTPYDHYFHGTGVCGVAEAVGNNRIGTVGISYTCQIMPIRIFGPYPQAYTTDLIVAKGLNWAWTHGADVFNLSWGGGIPTPLITNAIQNAFRFGRNGKGVVIAAGSGNDNLDSVLYPSSMPEVISMGGLSPCNERKSLISCDNYNDSNSWGASYGEGLSVVAPCSFIGTTHLLGGWGFDGNGTSVSAPMGAAVGALILAKNINLSADSVMIIIERSAAKVGNYSYNVLKRNGYWNNEMGYGRIDAKRALDMTPPGPFQIFDQVAPIIEVVPPQSDSFNSALNVLAKITDNQLVAGGSNSPRLYFYTSINPYTQIITGIPGGNDNYSFTIPALSYGTRMYYYIAAQDTSSNGNITTYPLGGKGVNPPGTVPPPRRLFLQNTKAYTNEFSSSDVPKYINAERETTVVSTLNNHINKTILDVDCQINITHSSDVDITVSLISPAGTEIVLTGGVPTRGNGDNYANTIFNDEAEVSISDTNYRPPYSGSFKPIDKLWLLDGENSLGQWMLKITDNLPQNGGVLNSWNISISYSSINESVVLPNRFSLVKNYPNPFNSKTRIVFNVPYSAKVRIVIYDILGREVKTLLDEIRLPKFEDFVDFNLLDESFNNGRGLASGVYFYSLFADAQFIESRRMVLLK